MMVINMLVGMHMNFALMFVAVDMHQVISFQKRDVRENLRGRRGFYDILVVAEHINPVRDLLDDMQVMSGSDNGLAGQVVVDQKIDDMPGSQRVKPGGGLIQDQHFGVDHQGGSYGHFTFFPDAQLVRSPFQKIFDVQDRANFLEAPADLVFPGSQLQRSNTISSLTVGQNNWTSGF